MRELSERERWFIDHIGVKIWRNHFCDCEICQKIYDKGLTIENREQALYCYTFESDTANDVQLIKYFASQKERDDFESSLLKSKL